MSERLAQVIEAELVLAADTNPAAVGAAVTIELCGSTDHDGPCRWPHNNAFDSAGEPSRLRTVYVADAAEADEVATRIEASLRAADGWRVAEVERRPIAAAERELAARLLTTPPPTEGSRRG